MNLVKINLNDFAKLQKFAKCVTKYASPVELWREGDPNKVYCAKSILSLMAIDLSNSVYVRIITTDEKESNDFYAEMEEFQ